MAEKDELGRRGEDLAAQFLESLDLVVLARNWRCREGELDIIATDRVETLVICEVKTRAGTGYGTPIEAVTYAKRRRMRRLAQLWLSQTGLRHPLVRFDVIGIVWPLNEDPQILHVPEAF